MWLFERQLATFCLATALETYFHIYCYIESLFNKLLRFLKDRSEILHNEYMSGENMHVTFLASAGTPLPSNDMETYFPIYLEIRIFLYT